MEKVRCKQRCGFEDEFEPDEFGINYFQAIGECPKCGADTVYDVNGLDTKVIVKFNQMKTGIEAITQERQEQLTKHNRTVEDDLKYNSSFPLALTYAAASLTLQPIGLALEFGKPNGWDETTWKKMCAKPYKERLAIAGALIAAEYDRVSLEERLMEMQ